MLALLLAVTLTGVSAHPTNLEMAEQVVAESLAGLPDSLSDAGVQSVRLELAGDFQGNWLVQQVATNLLVESGVPVLGERTAEGEPGTVLRLRVMELSVSLDDAGRSWFLGSSRIDRAVRCEVSAELLDGSASVRRSWRCGGSDQDRIPTSDLAELQGSSGQEWLTGGTPQEAGGGILEPLVVTGVVASLIYLFYSSRAE